MKQFDNNSVQLLRKQLEEAFNLIKVKHGIVINVGNMRYGPDHVTIRCEALIDNGSGLDAYDQSVQNNAKMYGYLFGITESMVGMKANIPDRGVCILLGCKLRSRKYPIVWKQSNGDRFKSTKEYLKYIM